MKRIACFVWLCLLYTSVAGAQEGAWTISHAPAANTQATATKAAGATGVRHISECILVTLTAGAVAPVAVQVTFVVRDGASGAGTIIWQGTMALTVSAGGSAPPIQLCGLTLVGSPATAMTIEFTAAAGINTFETVALKGKSGL